MLQSVLMLHLRPLLVYQNGIRAWRSWQSMPLPHTVSSLEAFMSFHAVRLLIPGGTWHLAQSWANGYTWTWLAGGTVMGPKEAMRAIADAITQCKFESSDPGSDEVILFKILQVSCPIQPSQSYSIALLNFQQVCASSIPSASLLCAINFCNYL